MEIPTTIEGQPVREIGERYIDSIGRYTATLASSNRVYVYLIAEGRRIAHNSSDSREIIAHFDAP